MQWRDGIMELMILHNNTGVVNSADYQTDLFVEQLDRDDTILKDLYFRNCFPTTIGQLNYQLQKQLKLKHLKLLGGINTSNLQVLISNLLNNTIQTVGVL